MKSSLGRLAPAGMVVLLLGTAMVGTAAAAHVSCGRTITQNTVLDGNLGPCSGTGIIIGANNITLDLNTFRVFGTSAPGEGPGILAQGRTGVTIRNGQVTNFDAGVVLLGGSGNTVNKILAQDNIGSRSTDFGDGIALFGSSDNTISGNIVRHNGPYDGIGLVGNSDDNLIEANAVQNNNIAFDQLDGGAGLPTGTMDDFGIRVEGPGANFNIVRANSVTGNGLDGILVFPSSNSFNRLQQNVARGNGFHDKNHRRGNGIGIGGNATRVEGNLSESNAASGIRVNSQLNDILSNTARNNALSVNQGTINVGGAFDLQDTRASCDANTWQGNIFGTRNQPCIN